MYKGLPLFPNFLFMVVLLMKSTLHQESFTPPQRPKTIARVVAPVSSWVHTSYLQTSVALTHSICILWHNESCIFCSCSGREWSFLQTRFHMEFPLLSWTWWLHYPKNNTQSPWGCLVAWLRWALLRLNVSPDSWPHVSYFWTYHFKQRNCVGWWNSSRSSAEIWLHLRPSTRQNEEHNESSFLYNKTSSF